MLGKIKGRRKRARQRMKWLDSISNSMDMSLSKLQEKVKDRKACIHRVTKSWTWLGFPLVTRRLKPLPAMQETWIQSLGWEDTLEKEMASHSSILAWRIPRTEEPGGLQSTGSQRVGHDWATSLQVTEQQQHCPSGFPGSTSGKDLPANAGDIRDVSSLPGLGRALGGGRGNPLQYPCLENPMGRGVWQATVHRVTKTQTEAT